MNTSTTLAACAPSVASATDRWHVDPDITVAETLDKDFYLDPAAWATAREKIFARSWQWIGTGEDVREPGSLSPRTLLPGFLDEPLLLARDRAGTMRLLSNVCTHRGNLLIDAPCQADQIRCPYHSRRFDLAGRMTFMPEFQAAKNFPRPADHLSEVPWSPLGDPTAGAGPQLFASLDPIAPAQAFFGDIVDRLGWLPIEAFQLDTSRSRDYEFDANWALYVENYLEGLHIPFIHPGLTKTLDLRNYTYELYRYANLQLAVARAGDAAFDLPESSPDHGQRIAAYYYWVFPNLMLNFYPWGLSLNVVQPLGPSRTRVQFRSFVGDPSLLSLGAGGALDEVEMEDEAVVQTVQRGLRSRFYARGRYSPTREQGVHHFHRLIGAFMGSGVS
jgi:choline monooxygenase